MPDLSKSPPELVERFEAITGDIPDAEHRQMFGYPAMFVGGNHVTGPPPGDPGSSAWPSTTGPSSWPSREPGRSSRCRAGRWAAMSSSRRRSSPTMRRSADGWNAPSNTDGACRRRCPRREKPTAILSRQWTPRSELRRPADASSAAWRWARLPHPHGDDQPRRSRQHRNDEDRDRCADRSRHQADEHRAGREPEVAPEPVDADHGAALRVRRDIGDHRDQRRVDHRRAEPEGDGGDQPRPEPGGRPRSTRWRPPGPASRRRSSRLRPIRSDSAAGGDLGEAPRRRVGRRQQADLRDREARPQPGRSAAGPRPARR